MLKKAIIYIIISILMFILSCLLLWWITSPEVWYAGSYHDGLCEENGNCKCLQRILKTEP